MPDSTPTERPAVAIAASPVGLASILHIASPEARVVADTVQKHLNSVLARFLNPAIDLKVSVAGIVQREVDRVLKAQRTSCLDELRQCSLELQEAANIIRSDYPSLADVFEKAATRTRTKVAATERGLS